MTETQHMQVDIFPSTSEIQAQIPVLSDMDRSKIKARIKELLKYIPQLMQQLTLPQRIAVNLLARKYSRRLIRHP